MTATTTRSAYKAAPLKKATFVKATQSATAIPSGAAARVSPTWRGATKSVRFAPTASVTARVASSEDLTNSWYGDEDYSSFETECRRTLAAVRLARQAAAGAPREGDHDPTEALKLPTEYTTNGLEDFVTPVTKKLRDYRKTCHSHHVLMHQFTQRCRGVLSPESLQHVSQYYSSESSELALRRGTMKLTHDC